VALWCQLQRPGRSNCNSPSPKSSWLSNRISQRPGLVGGQARGRVGARVLRAQISCDRRGRIALEVPPSDAKLPLNCRLLDGFVGIPPTYLRVNPNASFCGMRITGALWFSHWAIVAVVLRAQK